MVIVDIAHARKLHAPFTHPSRADERAALAHEVAPGPATRRLLGHPRCAPPQVLEDLFGFHSTSYHIWIPVVGVVREPSTWSFITSALSLKRPAASGGHSPWSPTVPHSSVLCSYILALLYLTTHYQQRYTFPYEHSENDSWLMFCGMLL